MTDKAGFWFVLWIIMFITAWINILGKWDANEKIEVLEGQIIELKKEVDKTKSDAIDHRYARFHPSTGEWEWIVPEE